MIIFLTVIGILICLNIIGFAVNRIFFSNELSAVLPYGQMTEVDGHKMHVYSLGSGAQTVVLLPGFGISLPGADFGPLMRELSGQYTVVCVEYFGIGFSDQTDSPRTNANYTQEIRTALSQAGFAPPFILMPHSASGIYCEYYAARYPDEVSAIIMLDTTSTAIHAKGGNPPRFVYSIAQLQQATGFTRITAGLVPPAQKPENGYTAKEIGDYKLFTYHVLNNTIIDQSLRMLENIKEVKEMPFPQDIPVLKLISSQSQKRVGKEYQEDHLARLGAAAESMIIDSNHFIYQTRAADICRAAAAFLDKNSLKTFK